MADDLPNNSTNRCAELEAEVARLRGTLRYIHTQAKTRPSGDALTLSVIERNADAALNDGFQAALRAALTASRSQENGQ